MTLEQALNNWKKINLNKIEQEILKELEPEIIDLNISQLSRGEGKSGSKFPEYANPDYFAAKRAQGLTEQAGDNYNLLLTGDFRQGFYLKQTQNESFVDSTDNKTPRLLLLTDNDIFGLQQQNLGKLIDDKIEDLICDRLEKKMS